MGYLGPDFYDAKLETGYVYAFEQQADDTGKLLLIFSRIVVVAVKVD